MLDRRLRIGFVSNSREVGDALKQSANPDTDDIIVQTASMEDAVPVARQLLRNGVEVILGGGGTGSLLAQTLGQPVVKIGRSSLDVLKALAAAREHGAHIGLTSFHEPAEGVNLMEQLLAVRIRQIIFDTSQELEAGIAAAVSENVNCIVGGGICKQITDGHGCASIIAMPGQPAIEQALREARSLALARRHERHEFERVNTILGLIKDGLIVVDANGQLEFANSVAQELLAKVNRDLTTIGTDFYLPEVLKTGRPRIDQICRVAGRDLVATVLPIQVDGKVDGAVATFNDAARVHNINRRLKEELYSSGFVAKYKLSDIKGCSPAFQRVIDDLREYANTDANLLIEGETGVGKELFAQSVHNLSRRRTKPFVAINCSALPESLLETELFGYDEGAFTGARRGGKIGLFELAQGGTLFLDEIADVSLSMQAKLLRVLEEKELMRVGGSRVVRVNARVVSSTYKNLFAQVQIRQFRNDLYFRLATLHIVVPPLRDRQEDVPELIKDALCRHGRSPDAISPSMLARLSKYEWPGNVRELDALVQRYTILLGSAPCNDQLVERLITEMKQSIAVTFQAPSAHTLVGSGDSDLSIGMRDKVIRYEQRLIAETLRACHYNRQLTAKRLGISLNTLWRKMPHDLNS